MQAISLVSYAIVCVFRILFGLKNPWQIPPETCLFGEGKLDEFAGSFGILTLTFLLSLEINVAAIAAAIPGLRPLWAKSTNGNQKNRGQARPPNDKQHLKSSYIIMDQQTQADSPPSCLETSITAQGNQSQKVGSEAKSLHDSTGIIKTSDISTQNFRKFEGNWIPEHSSLSDRERGIDDIV